VIFPVQVVGAVCGKAYLATIFQSNNQRSDSSSPPKLQSWWKIASSEIHTMKMNATLFFQQKWLKHVHVLLLAIYILSRLVDSFGPYQGQEMRD
jgi:hypothetical protein